MQISSVHIVVLCGVLIYRLAHVAQFFAISTSLSHRYIEAPP